MDKKKVPVLLLTGYLGSGKTTLLNRILTNRRGIKFAVIVNDIGEVNIDASLIAKGGIVSTNDDSLVALQNGCICCTLQNDLMQQVSDIMNQDFDYIVIEASGICEPEPIARTLCSMPLMAPELTKTAEPRLDAIVSVVDALRLKSEFESGEKLKSSKIAEEDIENLVIQQIEFCNIILLNKKSEVSAEDLSQIKEVLRALQPKAEIIECDYCDVDLDLLLNTHLFDYEKTVTSATWIQEIEKPLEEIEEEQENIHKDASHNDHHEHGHHHHEHGEHDHHHEHGEHDHHHEEDHKDCDHEHGVCHHHHHHHHHDGGETEEYGIGTFVYYRREPFDINKFDWFVGQKWPSSIIRAKGICYFSDQKDMSYMFEQAGVQKKLTEAGKWYATAPQDELEELLARDPGLMKDWDPEYGDRMQKIVFIGKDMDRQEITRLLDSCTEKK
ncbi:MAG: GTP-binding protein [Muribaculaceae bacterium]|nr:GTP-binding protein [Muribaculaceae bacterium]